MPTNQRSSEKMLASTHRVDLAATLTPGGTCKWQLSVMRLLCPVVFASLVGACGSGSSQPEVSGEDDPIATSQTDSNGVPAAGTDINTNDGQPANQPVDGTPADEGPTEDTVPVESSTVELSPIELLLNEISMAAISGIDDVRTKISSGVPLTEIENACLDTFDPATGELLTALDCPAGSSALALYNGILELRSANLVADAVCLQAISGGNSDLCTLQSASLKIPVEWVPLDVPSSSAIANITPIEGANIEYNLEGDGLLRLSGASEGVFVPFSCDIEIATASLTVDTAGSDCQREVGRIISRLTELRTESETDSS